MARLRLGLVTSGVLALAACGADNELVPIDDGLIEPPSVREPTSSSDASAKPPVPDLGGGSSSSSSSGSVAPAVEEPCDPNANFLDYTDIPGIPADASSIRLTGDELRAFYMRPGVNTPRIFSAARSATSAPFGPGVELGPSVNSGTVSDPFPSDDGLSLRFTANGNSVYLATRASLDAPFGAATLAIGEARSEVLARDGSIELFSRYERVRSFPALYLWILRGQPPGTPENRFAASAPDGDIFATWYEPLSKQAWVARGAETSIYTWDGSWQIRGPTDFRVSWSSPNGCRLYGRFGDALKIHARIPSPAAPPTSPDAG